MIQMAGVSLIDAIHMITMTPASIMKISDRKGSIVTGKDADIVIFDDDIHVHTTMVKGKIIYQAPDK
jgi:N-acetylglucosamine-6-phosphate deacetylase